MDKNKLTVLTKVGVENSDFNVIGLLESAAIVLMVGGAAILLLGFLGCCGAFKESQCLLCLVSIESLWVQGTNYFSHRAPYLFHSFWCLRILSIVWLGLNFILL